MPRTRLWDMYFQFCKKHPEGTVVFSLRAKPTEVWAILFPLGEKHIKCYSLPGKTQNSLNCTHFQAAMSNQMWDQIYCKRLLLGHESSSKSLMPWAQFWAIIIVSLVSPVRLIISHNFDMSPVETQWMVLLFGICWCFKTASFPQQRNELSALKWEGDPRQTVCTRFQYLYIWDSFNVDFCSNERGKGFLECLMGSDPNPWNTDLSETKVFQESQRKLWLPKSSLIHTDANADTHEV